MRLKLVWLDGKMMLNAEKSLKKTQPSSRNNNPKRCVLEWPSQSLGLKFSKEVSLMFCIHSAWLNFKYFAKNEQ